MRDRRAIRYIVLFTVISLMFAALILLTFRSLFPLPSRQIADIFTNNTGFAALTVIFAVVLVVFGIDLLYRFFIHPLNKLIEETAMIGTVNSSHRIKAEGGPVFGRLIPAINAIASRYEAVQRYGKDKIKNIQADAEKERNLLAAIMAELPEGILVCNTDGIILLYNQQVRRLFSRSPDDALTEHETNAFIGLFRSIYDVIDKNQLRYALDEIAAKLKDNRQNAAAYFVTLGFGGELLRVEVLPVLDHLGNYAGFILIFQDITRHLQAAGEAQKALTSLAREIRASSDTIQASVEAIQAYSDMKSNQVDGFIEIIYNESVALGTLISEINNPSNGGPKTEWPTAPVQVNRLLQVIREKAKASLDLFLSVDLAPVDFAIRVDSYALAMVFLFIMDRIAEKDSTKTIRCRIDREDNFIYFDLVWSGRPVTAEILRDWDARRLRINGEGLPFTLREIIKYHGAKVGVSSNPNEDNKSSLRLLFPLSDDCQVDRRRSVPILSQSRPEFFDFDLFGRDDPKPELAQRLLSELNYTVFDTETTGLDPGAGDEIIAIGALRIVNGRLLHAESMEQLIDPHRTIPVSSTRFHGIRHDMIKDRPGIDVVLPRFHRFVADTVLIGHNVAFDMRMLQEKETVTGIRFTNPVLDTLLLSAVIHPAQSGHTMEAIAARLGVSIQGRHTAIGDAVVTGKIFLKMLPLLAQNGILTLDDAMTASKKTFFARIKY